MKKTRPMPCLPEAWRRRGIVLQPTEDWEGSMIQNFLSTAEPLDGGKWRLWYTVRSPGLPFSIAVAEGVPGERMERRRVATMSGKPDRSAPLAIGNLPDQWRPVQPVHLALPGGKHRLYFWAHGPGILRFLAAESEDGCIYHVLDPARPCLYHPLDRAARGVTDSRAPGLAPAVGAAHNFQVNEPAARPEIVCNDAVNVYLLPDGTYELTAPGLVRVSRDDPRYMAHDNAPGLLRVIDRWTSGDGLHWENRRRVIECDAQDPVDQQFYYLAVNRTPRGCVGMLGHYRVQAQTMDLEWCFSADGLHWQRPARSAWLPRGPEDSPDCYGIYAGHSLVEHGGSWWLFYTGVNMAHNNRHSSGAPRSVIMLANADSIWAEE